MRQREYLDEEFNRLKQVVEDIKEMPPSDAKAAAYCRVDKIKNYIIYTDKLIGLNQGVGIILDRIHNLIDELLTDISPCNKKSETTD